jgi:hypothetical protein
MLRAPFSERFTLFEKGCSGGLLTTEKALDEANQPILKGAF